MEYYKNLDLTDIIYFDEEGNQKTEQWKDVIGYEGLYQVSDLGRVKSMQRICSCNSKGGTRLKKEKILKQTLQESGYIQRTLLKEGKLFLTGVHRLVAKAFISNPENKPEVNHKDCIKHHNYVYNLEWNTYKENIQHSWKNGLAKPKKGEKHNMSKLTEKDVLEIRELYKTKKVSEIAKMFPKVNEQAIWKIVKRVRWKHI